MDFYLLDHEATFDDLKKFDFPNQKIGVIAHIENKDGEILLQQRGKKSRDENGLYEDIGGKVEPKDINFKSAIMREVKEEAGDEANLEYSDSIGIYHCYKNNTNWIFIVYFVKYIEGDIKIMEPTKCKGYHFFKYDEALKSDLVTDSCKYLNKCIKDNIESISKIIDETRVPASVLEYGFDFDWDEKEVWRLDYPSEEIGLDKLEWHFDVPFWDWDNKSYILKPTDVINNPENYQSEYDRIMNSDISYPIDVMTNKERLVILDGLHRLVKYKLLGKDKVKVRIIPRSEIPNISKYNL